MRKRRIKGIERNAKGEIININLCADAGNADWIRAARLTKAGKEEELKKLHDTPMYEIDDEESESG